MIPTIPLADKKTSKLIRKNFYLIVQSLEVQVIKLKLLHMSGITAKDLLYLTAGHPER
jgi:hypothetical protein